MLPSGPRLAAEIVEAATDAEIKQACREANADEFIERFRDGYDTVVGDRGVRLSGGQCQRVALARAILRKPELLLLEFPRIVQSDMINSAKNMT